jgi:hypothetical protein
MQPENRMRMEQAMRGSACPECRSFNKSQQVSRIKILKAHSRRKYRNRLLEGSKPQNTQESSLNPIEIKEK